MCDAVSGKEHKVLKTASVALSEMSVSEFSETSVIPALEKGEEGTNNETAEETRLEVDLSGGGGVGVAGGGGVEAGVGGGGGGGKEVAGYWVDLRSNLLHYFLSLIAFSTYMYNLFREIILR